MDLHQGLGAVYLGERAHGARPLLRNRRRLRALLPRPRGRRPLCVRLRRLWAARRARGDRGGNDAHRVGTSQRGPHDRAARPPRLLVRLAAKLHELRAEHVPLVAVAIFDVPRRGAHLPRHGHGRLVPELQHDARDDPGRGRPLLALSRAGGARRAPAVVPAHIAVRRGERPPQRGARRLGRDGAWVPARGPRPRRRRRARARRGR